MAKAEKSRAALDRTKRERDPAATRTRILGAAESEFARKGYDGARLRDVADSAGVHHALLHHYYGDKEGLFRAVLERAIERLSTRAYGLLRSDKSFVELLSEYVDVLVDYYAENRNLVQMFHFSTLDEGSPAYAMCEEIAKSMILPLLEATTQKVERAQKDGVVRDDIHARRLVSMAIGAAAYVYEEDRIFSMFLERDVRSKEARKAHKQAVLKMLSEGLLAQAGSAN